MLKKKRIRKIKVTKGRPQARGAVHDDERVRILTFFKNYFLSFYYSRVLSAASSHSTVFSRTLQIYIKILQDDVHPIRCQLLQQRTLLAFTHHRHHSVIIAYF